MATQWCPGVGVCTRPSGDRAVVATTSLAKGAPICRIAAEDALDGRAAVADAAVAAALTALRDACSGVVPSVELAIVLKLAHEAFHVGTGSWTQYVRGLPPNAPGLMHAADADVSELLGALVGTPLSCVRAKRTSLEESLAAVCGIVRQPWCTRDNLRWAHGMFTSRAMMIPTMPPGSWRAVDVPAMVPLADMCNHSTRVDGSAFRYERPAAAAATAAAASATIATTTAVAPSAPVAVAAGASLSCACAADAVASASSPQVQLADLKGREAGYARMLDFLHALPPSASSGGGVAGASAATPGGAPSAAAARAEVTTRVVPDASPSGVVTLHTTAAVPVGSEVFINYGSKSNEELLLWYGFALASNKADMVDVELRQTAGTPAVAADGAGAAVSASAELDALYQMGFDGGGDTAALERCRLSSVQPAEDAVFACMRALLSRYCGSAAMGDATADPSATLEEFDPLASEADALARRLRAAFASAVPDVTIVACLEWLGLQLVGLASRVEAAAGRCSELAAAAAPATAVAAAVSTAPPERALLATAAHTCLMGYGSVLRAQASFIGEVVEALAACSA